MMVNGVLVRRKLFRRELIVVKRKDEVDQGGVDRM